MSESGRKETIAAAIRSWIARRKEAGWGWCPSNVPVFIHHHRWTLGETDMCLFCNLCRKCGGKHFPEPCKEELKSDSQPHPLASGISLNLAQSYYPFLIGPTVAPLPLQSLSASMSPSLPEAKREMPVVGFRMWQVKQGFKLGVGGTAVLYPANEGFGAWSAGVNRAICHRNHFDMRVGSYEQAPQHEAPAAECHCGLYVLTDLDQVPFRNHSTEVKRVPGLDTIYPQVAGVVVGWGRVIQHGNEGWRAQYAKVVALLDCKVSDAHLEMTQRVAESIGVPVLERPALEMLAREYGDPLPTEVEA